MNSERLSMKAFLSVSNRMLYNCPSGLGTKNLTCYLSMLYDAQSSSILFPSYHDKHEIHTTDMMDRYSLLWYYHVAHLLATIILSFSLIRCSTIELSLWYHIRILQCSLFCCDVLIPLRRASPPFSHDWLASSEYQNHLITLVLWIKLWEYYIMPQGG